MCRLSHRGQDPLDPSCFSGNAFRPPGKWLTLTLLFFFFFLTSLQQPVLSETTEYTYDVNGRLIRAQYGNGCVIDYTLDAVGNILSISSINPTAQTDPDGVPDGQEMGPQGNDPDYDGDGNGIPDYREARAASLPTAVGGQYATLSIPTGLTLTNVRAVGPPFPGEVPGCLVFPYGLFEFSVTGLANGGCTTATIHLPENRTLQAYYKFTGTPEHTTPHWYAFMDDGQTGAVIAHQTGKTTITLSLCDDRRGDGDLHLNGTISDPGGPVEIEQFFLYLPLVIKK